MVTLRCTKKLLKFLDKDPVKSPPPPTNTLGDWYANLIPTVLGDLIMFTNERSLLTVGLPVDMAHELIPQFKFRVANQLAGIGVPSYVILQELSEMKPVLFAKTASRSILGSMNDLAFHFQYYAQIGADERDYSLSKVELELNHMPHGPLEHRYAADAALAQLVNRKSSRN